MKVVVTGTNGFVGKRFMQYNQGRFHLLPLSLRTEDWSSFHFAGINTIVHLAGKAHDMRSTNDQEYFDVNFDLTCNLAQKAKSEGLAHFIYISSVKVYGDEGSGSFDENSPCHPDDAYGQSKLKAEIYLRSIETSGFKVAIVRPPLVYGPGVKGNLIRMLKLADTNYPLPFAGIGNKRSLVFLDNLVELLNRIIETGKSGTFVAGDTHPISTEELIIYMRRALHRNTRLVKLPQPGRWLLRKWKPSLFRRLFGSFVIDNRLSNTLLQFTPPYSVDYGIAQMVDWYMANNPGRERGGLASEAAGGIKSSGLV